MVFLRWKDQVTIRVWALQTVHTDLSVGLIWTWCLRCLCSSLRINSWVHKVQTVQNWLVDLFRSLIFFSPSPLVYICLVQMSSAILSSIPQCHGAFLQLAFFSFFESTVGFLPLSLVAKPISSPFSFPDHSWVCWAAKIPVGFHLDLPLPEKIDCSLQLFLPDF